MPPSIGCLYERMTDVIPSALPVLSALMAGAIRLLRRRSAVSGKRRQSRGGEYKGGNQNRLDHDIFSCVGLIPI